MKEFWGEKTKRRKGHRNESVNNNFTNHKTQIKNTKNCMKICVIQNTVYFQRAFLYLVVSNCCGMDRGWEEGDDDMTMRDV